MVTAGQPLEARKREFANALAARRRELGLTQEEVVERLRRHFPEGGVDQSSVSNWERGRSVPRGQNLDALERAVQVAPGTFFAILYPAPAVTDEAARSGLDIPNDLSDEERTTLETIVAGMWARRRGGQR